MTIQNYSEGYNADCYVLIDNRTKEFIYKFLDNFLPNREDAADEFEIPQYSPSPTIIYKTSEQLIDYLVTNKREVHTIYWRNLNESALRGAVCFFTKDEHLIVGLYCRTNSPDTSTEEKYFKLLQKFCDGGPGYITYEQPAPNNVPEFLEEANKIH